jgi:DNA-binding transcriptional regulator YbjK
MGRREELADAGVRLVARSGIRALTHRAVDVEAGVPAGSTTYYARSRRELTGLVVARITEQLEEDLRDLAVPAVLDDAGAVAVARTMLDRLAARADAQAVRLALLSELRDDPELRAPLTSAAPVRAALVDTPATHAVDLVGLVDALLLYDVAAAAPLDASRVLTAYIAGLPRR